MILEVAHGRLLYELHHATGRYVMRPSDGGLEAIERLMIGHLENIGYSVTSKTETFNLDRIEIRTL